MRFRNIDKKASKDINFLIPLTITCPSSMIE